VTIERHRLPGGMRLHPLRAQDLTASDIGAVAGVSKYRTPLQVYGEKTGLIVQGEESNIMRRGRWLEAAAIEALREELPGWRIEKANVYVRDAELRLGAHPDALAEDPEDPGTLVNIQIKTVSRSVFEREWADESVPLEYQLQVLTEGLLLSANLNLIAALVIDTYSCDLVIRDVPRHAAAEARIRDIAATFWGNIAAGVRPAPDYTRDVETIEAIHHAEAGKTIDLTGDNRLAELLPERANVKAAAAGCMQRLLEIDAEIKDKLGDAEIATLPGWRLTWKEEQRKGYTVAPSTRRPLKVTEQAA
jgi:predicted phage-related endonuclease